MELQAAKVNDDIVLMLMIYGSKFLYMVVMVVDIVSGSRMSFAF